MTHILAVGIGGMAGAIARYLVALGMERVFGQTYPVGTLTVNILGSFLMGIAYQYGITVFAGDGMKPALFMLVSVGFLGAFTTFSTFSLDIVKAIQRGGNGVCFAGIYIAVSIVGGIAAVFGGSALFRVITK